MQSRKKYFVYLLISVLSLAGFLLLINLFPPTETIDIVLVKIPVLVPFFGLLFLMISCLITFIFKSKRRGIFLGIFICVFLLLQFLKANNLFYSGILIAILILLEILFWKKRT